MNLKQFVDKYNGNKADFDGSYGSQCVDLFRFYNKEVLDIPQPKSVNGAKDFWSNYSSDQNLHNNFEKIANTPEFVANAGDVMIWNGYYGQYGHIAIVTKADINKFTCLSQNDPTGRETHLKEYTYSKVYGVLRPKVQSIQESMQLDKKVFEDLVAKATKLDEFTKAGYPDAQSVQLTIDTKDDQIREARENKDKFLKELVNILDPNSILPELLDESWVKSLAKMLTTQSSDVQDELNRKQKEWIKEEQQLEAENLELEKQVKSLKKELEDMRLKHQLQIDILEKRIDKIITDTEQVNKEKAENKVLQSFFTRLLSKLMGVK